MNVISKKKFTLFINFYLNFKDVYLLGLNDILTILVNIRMRFDN